MKVFSTPVPAPKVDFANFDRDKMIAAEVTHMKAVETWLKEKGYTGKHTGEIVRFPRRGGKTMV